MKKILIFSHAMELGGAERALLGLLEALDLKKVQVDLFLMRHSGELMDFIPDGVHLLPEKASYACLAVPITEVLKRGHLLIVLRRLIGKNAARCRIRELRLPPDNDVSLQYSHKYTLRCMPQVSDEEYDLAISFLTPHYFVTERVKAKKKIAWIHTDYSQVAVDREEQLRMWDAYDNIISISDTVSKSFLSVFPSLRDKILLIPHVLPARFIQEQASAFSPDYEMPLDGSCRLLSIGRFCYAKNFDEVPFICKLLLEMGLAVKWYLIGYGSDEPLIRQNIEQAGMEDHVIILGKKENPYPYIRSCDLYVQPSRYEGKCVSVMEAQILGKPVVITKYPTSSSQLHDDVDGVIVPMDTQGCAKGIAELLRDEKKCRAISRCGETSLYRNRDSLFQLYALIDQ